MRRIIVTCISVCMAVCLSAQSTGLFTHTRGYFIKNGDSWEEYLTSSRTGLWSSYSQYSEDANYYYISNSSCSVAVPKTSANSFYLRNGDDWDIVYQTCRVYGAFNDSGRDLYCHENGYFVREGNAWRLYLPEKRSGVWASFTTYREDDNFYYVSNSNDQMAIPKESVNSFYLLGEDENWLESYTDTDIYFGGTGASSSGQYPYRNDDAEGLFAIACNYFLGEDGYEENHEKAFSYFKKAADAGLAPAQYMTGTCYADGDGVEKDLTAAFTYLKKAADAGVSESYWPLGSLYYYGNGVEKDYDSAFVYLKKAAAAGVVESYCLLANMYLKGKGTAKNEANAFLYASKAAEGGDVDGLSMLAKLYYGGDGVKEDNKKAFEYALKAAEAGSTDGQAFLGMLYYTGGGVRKNYKKAVSWLTKAAESGNPDGMILLAECYYNGEGVKADADTAKEWFDRAADAKERITAYFSFYYDKMLFSIYSYEFESLF